MQRKAIQRTTLPNGITIISDKVLMVRSVSIGLWINKGSRDESPELNGVYHLLEHLVFKGTRRRNYVSISKSIERVGGYLNAFTTKEHTCFYAHLLGENFDLAIDVLFDIGFRAIFPEEEFEKEKAIVLEELKSIEEDPEDVIFDRFEKLIYKNHALGFPIAGTPRTLKTISLDTAKQTAKDSYIPDTALVVACGNIDHDALVSSVKKHTPRHSKKAKLKRNLFTKKSYKPFYKEIKKQVFQAHGIVGLSFERNDKYYFPVLLLNTLLGGGMSSRLNLELREKQGVAYHVYSNFSSYDETNTFGTYITTDKKHLKKSICSILLEFEKVANKKVSKQELDLVKTLHRGGILLAEENMHSRMNQIARDEYYFQKYFSTKEYLSLIQDVTSDQILDVSQMLFEPSNISTLIFLPMK